MKKISIFRPDGHLSILGTRAWKKMGGSLLKKKVISAWPRFSDSFGLTESDTVLYRKETMIRDGRMLLVKEAEENEAGRLIHYIRTIRNESPFLAFDDGLLNISVANEKKFLRRCRRSYYHVLLVGWLQNEIVGYLAFQSGIGQRLLHSGDFVLSVSKKNWGLGIGRRIACSLLDWGRRSSAVKTIQFRVHSDNTRARRVYSKLGFVAERSLVWDFFNHVVMRLRLT